MFQCSYQDEHDYTPFKYVLHYSKGEVVAKKQQSFFRDCKFFIYYKFGALYCYQKIGCFKKGLGTIQFFIFNHWDLGDFFTFFGGFFVIFKNVWNTRVALVHFVNVHFTLFALLFEIFVVWRYFYDVVILVDEVKWEGGTDPGVVSTPLG